MAIYRLYTGDDGKSHMDELDLASQPDLTTLHASKGIVFRAAEPGRFSDWHNAPRRQYVVTLSGESEVELGDGTKIRLYPGHILLAEDVTGQGHISRALGSEDRYAMVTLVKWAQDPAFLGADYSLVLIAENLAELSARMTRHPHAALIELELPTEAERRAFIGREITKLHEQCLSRTLLDLKGMLNDDQISPKGEFVLAVEGQRVTDSSTVNIDLRQLLQEMVAVLPGSQAVDVVASLTGRGRNEIYRLMLSLAADEE